MNLSKKDNSSPFEPGDKVILKSDVTDYLLQNNLIEELRELKQNVVYTVEHCYKYVYVVNPDETYTLLIYESFYSFPADYFQKVTDGRRNRIDKLKLDK